MAVTLVEGEISEVKSVIKGATKIKYKLDQFKRISLW